MPVTHGGLVMAGAGGRCAGQGGAGAALCTGLLGAIGSPVIDRGGQQLRQSHWQTLCPFGFLLMKHRETCGFILAKKTAIYYGLYYRQSRFLSVPCFSPLIVYITNNIFQQQVVFCKKEM